MKFLTSFSKLCCMLTGICLLSACSGLQPAQRVESRVPLEWEAPLPHQGSVVILSEWWESQGDLLLVELIRSAQSVSPTVSAALARVEFARAQQVAAQARLQPSINAQTGVRRGVALPGVPLATRTDVGFGASWELDLMGANRTEQTAAQGRLQGSEALWHDARVSVAAEVAQLYFSLGICQQQAELERQIAQSHVETARLTGMSANAGFNAASDATIAWATAAQSASRLNQHQAQCELQIKGLVALSGMSGNELREKVSSPQLLAREIVPFSIANLPVQVISQRPDVFSAERDVVWAASQVGIARAARYPRLSLDGFITGVRLANAGTSQDYNLWSFGPLALDIPLFDAGRRKAAVDSAQAAYRDAVVAYQGKVRQAVREVEEAMVNLRSTQLRMVETRTAASGYAHALTATRARYAHGLASLLELEEARRNALTADNAVLMLSLEQRMAWISLYRAAGGGFTPEPMVANVTHSPQPMKAN
jgi:multidrug efflux system outer membrane protein